MGSTVSTAIRAAGTIAAAVLTAAAFVASERSETVPGAATRSTHPGEVSGEATDATRTGLGESASASVRSALGAGETNDDGRRDSGPISLMPDDPDVHLVAHATVPEVAAFDEPHSTTPDQTLLHPTPNRSPLVFLVEEWRSDGWLRVQLPVRPNGSTGWIREHDVEVRRHPYRIVVDVTGLRFRLYEGPELVVESPIAVGKDDTPTPGGTFYIKELLKPPDPDTVYGPFAFGLSGFSNALSEFAGGEGVIGIHGTDDPAAIGQRVSHGCIRLPNDTITELAGLLPLGTPVSVVG